MKKRTFEKFWKENIPRECALQTAISRSNLILHYLAFRTIFIWLLYDFCCMYAILFFVATKYKEKINKPVPFVYLVVLATVLLSSTGAGHSKRTTIWKINDTISIGGLKPMVLGAPKIVHDKPENSLLFDGIDDGLIVPLNPLQGLKNFSVEVLFKPVVNDSVAPRMIHIQDKEGNRCTIELRITPRGNWYLDAFLKNGKTNKGLTLFDSVSQHRCGQWYWAALTYDGTTMLQYVNALKEKEGKVSLDTMTIGQTSVGVRLNHINWFKGQIGEIRFHPFALKSKFLQH